jgi:hypothetical protein
LELGEPKQQPLRVLGAPLKRFFPPLKPSGQIAHPSTPNAWQVTLAAENTEYVSLMRGVELVMSYPGSHDLPVSRIFTHDMFLDLRQELAGQVHKPKEQF